ncbi:MAG TPA: ABC-2 family transporter protein [Candidatus Paceibacterota bacterium]
MKEIRLATKILKTLIKDSFQYPSRLVAETIIVISRCGLLLLLYSYVFKINNGVINGTTFLFSAWSIFLYFSLSTLKLRQISKLIAQDVQSGNVEVLFSKPASYLFYRMWWQIGSGLYSFIVITIMGVIVLIALIGIPHTMTIGIFIPTLILTFIFGIILSLFLYTIVGLLSFWIEDSNPVFWTVDKAVMILGGSYLPIALFPPLMYKIALYTPFGSSQFVTHTVYESWQTTWTKLIGIQLFWVLISGLVVYLIFRKAKQKVSVNGG